ncbi:MAG: NADH-quinone oxidoreductase subunit NuoH [Verrucomicrobiae bacterium]|nr:NADH-quinone oxidoreductase subunit NuoH [Verrucomicrobiae bacterium]
MNALDQIFVTSKHALVGLFPGELQPWISAVVSVGAILAVFPLLFALTTVVERKTLARMQNRPGPNRVGPAGFLQFAADGIKSLTKEDIVPRAADRLLHFLAPLVVVVPPVLAFAVLPVGRNMVALDLPETGLLFFLMVGTAVELGVFMAGWSSHNKYSLLGAMRALAQLLSYELPLVLSTVTVVMLTGSLSLVSIIEQQDRVVGGFLTGWNVFTPWGAAGALLFFIAAIAEANRSPFDLPEAESEIVAGYFTEYSGFKFALFFLGEYLGLFAITGLGITLFLGGWLPLFPFLDWVPSWMWFFGKLGGLMLVFIWLRGTLPRLRMDQLMQFAWQFLLPMSLINLVVAGVWHFTTPWPAVLRWALGIALLAGPWSLYARAFATRHPVRHYRHLA